MDSMQPGNRRGTGPWGQSCAMVLVVAAASLAQPASAFQLLVTGGGVTAPTHNAGCESGASNCNVERDFLLDLPGFALGSLEIDSNDPSFDPTVLSVSFGNPDAAPGDLSHLSFGGVSYRGSAYALTSGDMADGFSIVVPLVGPPNVVSSFETADSSRGVIPPPTPSDVDAKLLSFSCLLVGGTGECGLQLGHHGFTHTFNLSVAQALPGIPEP